MGDASGLDRRAWLARCSDAGFTPGLRAVPPLLEIWAAGGDDRRSTRALRETVARALSRGGRAVAQRMLQELGDADGERRAMAYRVAARIHEREPLPAFATTLARGLADPWPRVVREAARAAAKIDEGEGAQLEPALLSAGHDAATPQRKAIADALGRLGGAEARRQLLEWTTDDEDLQRRIGEAVTLIERRAQRVRTSRIELARTLPAVHRVVLRSRSGAARVVAEQAALRLGRPGRGPQPAERGDDAVTLPWSQTLGELHAVRSATEVALEFVLPPGVDLASRTVAALTRPDLIAAMQAWTEGTPRFRLRLVGHGRARALVWEVARELSRRESPLVNDSRAAPWTIEVDEAAGRVACIPRGRDPRFEYRRADVPAASHPTLAALLAWLGRPQPGERVWDPFCGSGSELIECALLQPGLHLCGTDLDPAALDAARTNFDAAAPSVRSVCWQRGDARRLAPPQAPGVSLILSNPPMGRRLARDGSVHALWTRFVAHAAEVLAPGGRILWVCPFPKVTAEAGRSAGLVPDLLGHFDMGGFSVAIQRMRRPP